MTQSFCNSLEKMKNIMEQYKWPGIMKDHVEHAKAIHDLAEAITVLLRERDARKINQ